MRSGTTMSPEVILGMAVIHEEARVGQKQAEAYHYSATKFAKYQANFT